jgi:hypothetical protein
MTISHLTTAFKTDSFLNGMDDYIYSRLSVGDTDVCYKEESVSLCACFNNCNYFCTSLFCPCVTLYRTGTKAKKSIPAFPAGSWVTNPQLSGAAGLLGCFTEVPFSCLMSCLHSRDINKKQKKPPGCLIPCLEGMFCLPCVLTRNEIIVDNLKIPGEYV